MLPFASPPGTLQLTAGFPALLTVAENCCCVALAGHEFPASFAYIFTGVVGLTLTPTAGIVTADESDLLVSACNTATTLKLRGVVPELGTVNNPESLIVDPSAPAPLNDHVTAVLLEFETTALNCCVPPSGMFALDGLTETEIGSGPILPPPPPSLVAPPPPPQAISIPSDATDRHSPPAGEYFETLRPAMPAKAMPAMGNASDNQEEPERRPVRRRSCGLLGPVPTFGPVEATVSVTLVALAPAAIDGGSKVQLLFMSVGSAGLKVQLNVTAPANV